MKSKKGTGKNIHRSDLWIFRALALIVIVVVVGVVFCELRSGGLGISGRSGLITDSSKLEKLEVATVAVDEAGNVYEAGRYLGEKVQDIAAAFGKFDPEGNLIWARVIDSPEVDRVADLVFKDSSLYLLREKKGEKREREIYVEKYSGGGRKIWSVEIGGEAGNSIDVNSKGEVYAAAYDKLVAVSSSGEVLKEWEVNFPGDISDVKTSGSYIYAAGSKLQSLGDNRIDSNIYLKKFDGGLNEIWTKEYGEDGFHETQPLVIVSPSEDSVYLLASARNREAGGYSPLVIAYNVEGEKQWDKKWEGEGKIWSAVLNQGEMYIGGQWSDLSPARISLDGKVLWKGGEGEKRVCIRDIAISKGTLYAAGCGGNILRYNIREMEGGK